MQLRINNTKLFWGGLVLFEVPLLLGFCFWRGSIPMLCLAGLGILTLIYSSFSLSKDNQFLNQIKILVLFFKKNFYLIFIIFSMAWLGIAIVRYVSVDYYTLDIGSFAYEIAQFVKTGRLYSTILNRHVLADHFVPNLLIFYPFFKVYPSFLWLTAFQIAAFLSSVFVLIRIGKQVIPHHQDYLVIIAPAIFLIHNLVALTVLHQTQPSAFSLPFILLAFSFAIDKKYVKMFVVLVFLLGFKENLALVWISLGMFFVVHLNKIKLGICLVILGTISGLLIYFVIMPHFYHGNVPSQIGRFGPFSLITQKIFLITVSLISVGLLPLLAPKSLLYILPAFGLALVAGVPTMVSFNYHYQDIPLTVLFIGVIYGLKSLATGKSWLFKIDKKYYEYIAAIIFIVIIFSNPRFPTLIIKDRWPSPDEILLLDEIKRYQKIAPTDVKLWADERIGPFLIDHPHLKSFDRWGGWTGALSDTEPHIIVVPVETLSALPPKYYREFRKKMDIALAQGKYREIKEFNKLLVYQYVH